ncbi:MAG TPA: capsid cement protein [Amycolatopsis sp.]|nr:capsid cement protein [Amycolatopsis sp.]
MADYTPVYQPGTAISLTASATVTGGQVVMVSGSGTVAPATTAGQLKRCGVAAFDAANGAGVTVFGFGTVHETVNNGGVTAGDLLVAQDTGNVATLAAAGGATAADINSSRAVIGIALTTATTGNKVRWMAN